VQREGDVAVSVSCNSNNSSSNNSNSSSSSNMKSKTMLFSLLHRPFEDGTNLPLQGTIPPSKPSQGRQQSLRSKQSLLNCREILQRQFLET